MVLKVAVDELGTAASGILAFSPSLPKSLAVATMPRRSASDCGRIAALASKVFCVCSWRVNVAFGPGAATSLEDLILHDENMDIRMPDEALRAGQPRAVHGERHAKEAFVAAFWVGCPAMGCLFQSAIVGLDELAGAPAGLAIRQARNSAIGAQARPGPPRQQRGRK